MITNRVEELLVGRRDFATAFVDSAATSVQRNSKLRDLSELLSERILAVVGKIDEFRPFYSNGPRNNSRVASLKFPTEACSSRSRCLVIASFLIT